MSEVIPIRNNTNCTCQAKKHTLYVKVKGDLHTSIAGEVTQQMLRVRLSQLLHAVLYVCVIQLHKESLPPN